MSDVLDKFSKLQNEWNSIKTSQNYGTSQATLGAVFSTYSPTATGTMMMTAIGWVEEAEGYWRYTHANPGTWTKIFVYKSAKPCFFVRPGYNLTISGGTSASDLDIEKSTLSCWTSDGGYTWKVRISVVSMVGVPYGGDSQQWVGYSYAMCSTNVSSDNKLEFVGYE